jgi:outer membrane protein TolC
MQLFCLVCGFTLAAGAQIAASGGAGSSTAQQLPLSGRSGQPGTVTYSESTNPEGGSALLVNGSVSVQGSYSGSVPTGDNTGRVLPLSLDYALKQALRYNLGAVSESDAERQAEGQRRVARSALLPQANSVVNEVVEQLDLRTLGVEVSGFPAVVGPFNYFDARAARVTAAVVDLARLGNLRSATQNLSAVRFAARDARDLIVLAVAGSYLQIIATTARIVSAAAQVRSSESIYQQAVDRLKEGLNARIDTTRTQVQLQIDRQRLRSLAADRDRQKLQLARLIGLPLGQDFGIADDFPYAPLHDLTFEMAFSRAMENRADLQAAESSVRAAELALQAARAERLPNLALTADYGAAGLRPTNSAHGVFTVTGTLTIPLYQGGRIRGEIEEAQAVLRQRQAEADDVRGRIDQDVRQAFIDLNAAADQVEVARSNVALAEDTLRQSRDRFLDGIADTVEVVQAQQSVAVANDDYVGAVFAHNLAKVALVRAMGNAERGLPALLVRK